MSESPLKMNLATCWHATHSASQCEEREKSKAWHSSSSSRAWQG